MEPITATLMANLFNSYVFLEAELLPVKGGSAWGQRCFAFPDTGLLKIRGPYSP